MDPMGPVLGPGGHDDESRGGRALPLRLERERQLSRTCLLHRFTLGNAYVDIIGVDAYDSTGVSIPAVGQPGRFAALAGEPDGLDAVEAFAAANNKPLSIPEWGCVASGSATNAGGDDADYVTNMGTFVATHDVSFQSYFDPNDDGILPLDPAQAPLSLAAYSKAFG